MSSHPPSADGTSAAFFAACERGDVDAVREMVQRDPALVAARRPGGATGLHVGVRHPRLVRLLLSVGADPNMREDGDHALALHFAAGAGLVETARVLIDGGSDVHGEGDAHHLGVIGWATVFDAPHRDIVRLLLSRGARHHVFSAIACGDRQALRELVTADPSALDRRLSPTEGEQTALHYVIAPPDGLVGGRFRTGDHYATLAELLAFGAPCEARDARGRTPLEVAMLRGDGEAMRQLHVAGASWPEVGDEGPVSWGEACRSVQALSPMLSVPDVEATVRWYESIGGVLSGSHVGDRGMDWASVTLGPVELMFVPSRDKQLPAGTSLWIRVSGIDAVYGMFRARQLRHARALLAGHQDHTPGVAFQQDLYTAFYGQREFCVRDLNGVELCFHEPLMDAGQATGP